MVKAKKVFSHTVLERSPDYLQKVEPVCVGNGNILSPIKVDLLHSFDQDNSLGQVLKWTSRYFIPDSAFFQNALLEKCIILIFETPSIVSELIAPCTVMNVVYKILSRLVLNYAC